MTMPRSLTLFIFFLVPALSAAAQDIMVSGVVMDSSRKYTIPAVKVKSARGAMTYTDSIGHYNILVNERDSIAFTYRNKSTNWFPVRDMKYATSFDVALQVRIEDRYQMLKEVIVIKKSHREDSLDNRERYARIFNSAPGGGLRTTESNSLYNTPGFDPNEIINMFRFKRNRNLRAFQQRLLDEEAEKFINYRFNKALVKQLSGFEGAQLDSFMVYWRPSYDFAANSTDYEFHSYILNASRLYRQGIVPEKEEIR